MGDQTVTSGNNLSMHYTGTIDPSSATGEKGKQFDSSRGRGQTFDFEIGAGEVIKGWDQGIVGLCVGAKANLIIPPELGYGENGAGGDIPGGATLHFDVEVVSINAAPEQPEDESNEDAAGPGGCYDMTIHKCNCNPESCSAELCAAAQMLWTAECPELCAPEKCPAASFVMVTGGATVTEDFIPVVLDGEGGACYDPIIHKCNCHADTCSAESCAAASMIWSADCPDHCNPEDCPTATFSSSASTNTLEEEETTSAVEAPTTTSGSSLNEDADTTATSTTDPEVEASSGSSRMKVAATTTTVATIGVPVVVAALL